MRKLRFHERKLLKKVDFINWKADRNLHELKILRRYYIQKREDYTKYNKLAREIRDVAKLISEIDPKDPFRVEATALLLDKLYHVGLVPTRKSLELCDHLSASTFCRRRLPVLMVRSHMAQTLKLAVSLVEQGHVRVGTKLVTDPALLVARNMEERVTWTDTSAIRKHVAEYNEERDDFELQGE